MIQEIHIIDDDIKNANDIKVLFKKDNYEIKCVLTDEVDIAFINYYK